MGGIERLIRTVSDMMLSGLEKYGRYYSFYTGIVVDVEDPDGLNRIKVKVPEIFGGTIFPSWVLAKSNFAGKNYGCRVLPQKGDLVTIEFHLGNARRPRWSHGYFANDPKSGKSEIEEEELKSTKNRWFRTPFGMSIQFNDEKKSVMIKHPSGLIFSISEDSTDMVCPDGKLINLGSFSEASEFAVKGETLKDQLSVILEAIIQMQMATSFGTTSTPINAADFLDAKAKLELFLSSKVKLD